MDSWLANDKRRFTGTLADIIDIRECYGASYSTREEAEEWFIQWNKRGKVLEWRITDTFYDAEKKLLFAAWVFHYDYPGAAEPLFDGMTMMAAPHGKITMLYEYQTKHQRFYPYR